MKVVFIATLFGVGLTMNPRVKCFITNERRRRRRFKRWILMWRNSWNFMYKKKGEKTITVGVARLRKLEKRAKGNQDTIGKSFKPTVHKPGVYYITLYPKKIK